MLILDRYVLRELVRTFVLTAAVLVLVIAFGAAIKPLANDRLLSAVQVAKYITLAIVPMLQFALPFAAGFAATLTLHRFATDNEVVAMLASGVSHRRIIAPVVGLGLALFLVMVVLTQWMIPRFWGLMGAMIATDVTRIFERAISRGEPFQMGRVQIYADDIVVQENPPESSADVRMILLRGVAAELDDTGRIITDVSFRQAVADLYREQGRTLIKLVMRDTVAFNQRTSQLYRLDYARPERPFLIGHAREDDPVNMTVFELKALRADSEQFHEVREAREELARVVRDMDLFRSLDAALRRGEPLRFVQAEPVEVEYVVEAAGLSRRRFEGGPDQPVTVLEVMSGTPVRRYRPGGLSIDRSPSRMLDAPTLDLLLAESEVEDLTHGSSNRRAALTLAGLTLAGEMAQPAFELSSQQLLARLEAEEGLSGGVKARIEKLRHEIARLHDEIASRLAKRYAICVTAPLLLALGAVLAMWRRQSQPLIVYLWAFLPSVVDLILISGGEHILREGRPVGWLVLWSGNAALAALLAFSFHQFSKR